MHPSRPIPKPSGYDSYGYWSANLHRYFKTAEDAQKHFERYGFAESLK